MKPISINQDLSDTNVVPLCPVFGECGGCLYQNIAYSEELKIKENGLKSLVRESFDVSEECFDSITASPKPYHYRNRLDLKLKRTKSNEVFIGFTPSNSKGVLPVDACYIAEKPISDFIPELKQQAINKLTAKYRVANLTVRTGMDGRVFWGGIGRRSCELPPKDYFWVEIEGKRIFYSLDTFFQANLSILPKLFEKINSFNILDSNPVFFDLYGGVGLFGIGLYHRMKKVYLIEENVSSLKVARHNVEFNQLNNLEIIDGRVEERFPDLIEKAKGETIVAMIDPPRAGLSEKARQLLMDMRGLNHILYLSCNPESLVRDLKCFIDQGWGINNIAPFDFFPKTRHLETLVLLSH